MTTPSPNRIPYDAFRSGAVVEFRVDLPCGEPEKPFTRVVRALSVNGLRSTIALFGPNQPRRFEYDGVNIEHALRLITPGVGPVVWEKDPLPPLRPNTYHRHGNWLVFDADNHTSDVRIFILRQFHQRVKLDPLEQLDGDKLTNLLASQGILQLQTKTVVSSRVSPRASRPPIAYEVPLRARLNIQRLQKFLAQNGNRLKVNLRKREEEIEDRLAYIDSLKLDDCTFPYGTETKDSDSEPRDR